MTSKCMFVFYVTWRKAIRKLFDIPNRTHCDLLPIIADCKHIETQLLCRLVKFICGAISSQNLHLNMLIDIAMNGSLSPMADSFNHLLSKSKITRYMAKHCDANVLLNIVSNTINIPTESCCRRGIFARTVLFDREFPSFLSTDDLNSILHVICTG